MNSAVHRGNENDLEERQTDREINLSATVILGIFFALSIVCAVFFGLGYGMGRKAGGVGGAPVQAVQVASPFGGAKPGAGSAVGATVTVPLEPKVAVVPKAAAPVPEAEAAEVPVPTVVAAVPVVRPEAVGTGTMMVQVAAVSHQEDADLLVTTLKRRGYAVAIHNEAQDKLLHVQVGPFGTHKDAEAMRQKLLADGFNAIVKEQK